MFGRNWERGRATIVARKNLPRNSVSSSYEYIADVQPDAGGPAFRATFHSPQTAYGFNAPDIGEVAPVFCDLKHGKVKFDTDAPSLRWDTGMRAEAAYFDSVKKAPPAPVAPPPVWQPGPTGLPTDADMETADEAFYAAVETGRAAIEELRRAKTSGDLVEIGRWRAAVASDNAEVQRLNAEFKRLAALRPEWRSGRPLVIPGVTDRVQTGPAPAGNAAAPTSAPAGPAPAPTGNAADRIAQLEKLADLRDRGILTVAEFTSEKARILDED